MPFANSILTREPTIGDIGLVPCAVGNTNISMWMRGCCLYDRMLTRVRAAMVEGEGGVLRGMLWYQGENDANPFDSKLYKSRLQKFFNPGRVGASRSDLTSVKNFWSLDLYSFESKRVGIILPLIPQHASQHSSFSFHHSSSDPCQHTVAQAAPTHPQAYICVTHSAGNQTNISDCRLPRQNRVGKWHATAQPLWRGS